jgi:signal-transduction protein with cAMP-binding, CBS, and nucleotidyltransferase domain
MKVNEFMTTKIESIDGSRSVYDAVEIMVDRRIRSLVVKMPGKEPKHGVVTGRDVVFKVLAKGINPKDTKVSEIASQPIVCVDKEMVLEDAATLMEKSNIARLFVCEKEKVIGLVSLLDVMAAELIMRARGNHGF